MPDPIVMMDDGAVRIIPINRPEKKNALTLAMYVEMTRALREAEASDAIRCVIFAGAPGSLCAGKTNPAACSGAPACARSKNC